MNEDQVEGRWKQVRGEASRLWGKLTDDDWKAVEGDLAKLAGRIQERYGDAQETISEQLGKLVARVEAAAAPPG